VDGWQRGSKSLTWLLIWPTGSAYFEPHCGAAKGRCGHRSCTSAQSRQPANRGQ
jgi:hypothetical protein